jgi:hypothetical protein
VFAKKIVQNYEIVRKKSKKESFFSKRRPFETKKELFRTYSCGGEISPCSG